jgi:hypothetical protein
MSVICSGVIVGELFPMEDKDDAGKLAFANGLGLKVQNARGVRSSINRPGLPQAEFSKANRPLAGG